MAERVDPLAEAVEAVPERPTQRARESGNRVQSTAVSSVSSA